MIKKNTNCTLGMKGEKTLLPFTIFIKNISIFKNPKSSLITLLSPFLLYVIYPFRILSFQTREKSILNMKIITLARNLKTLLNKYE
jgi:hypothetical protein